MHDRLCSRTSRYRSAERAVGLVQNGDIANQVIAQLGDQLKPVERDPATLLRKVKAELGQKGDLILIKVKDSDPQKAAAIANAWAREYERSTNNIYGGAPSEYSSSVQTELERTRGDYEQAQKALEAFVARTGRTSSPGRSGKNSISSLPCKRAKKRLSRW